MPNFHVPDMTCDGCVRAITQAIHATDPAAEVAAEVATHLVRVTSDQPAARLVTALQDAGFTPALA